MNLKNVNFITDPAVPIVISAESFTLLTNFNQDVQFYVSGTGRLDITLPALSEIKQTGNLFIMLTSTTATVRLYADSDDNGITSGGSLSSYIDISGQYNYVYVSGTNDTVWVVTNSNGNGVSSQSAVFNSKTVFTPAQVKAFNTSPQDLIPAPGAGKITQIMYVLAGIDYVSTPYATHTELAIYCQGANAATNSLTANSAILPVTASSKGFFGGGSGVNPSVDAVFANAPIKITALGGNPTAGDSPLTIYSTYLIINV